jgi:murein DD-endopeptidase MepM/ murein hydrolase activator NlpD
MKFPNIGLQSIGSVKARCKSHKNKIAMTIFMIATLALLMTSLMWSPAEATFTTEGYGIFVDGEKIVSTLSAADANAILDGVAAKYQVEGAWVVGSGYGENVTIQKCEVVVQNTKNVADGIAYIVNRATPLITVLSTQKYEVAEEIPQGDGYTLKEYSYDITSKVKAEEYNGTRLSTILITLENDQIVEERIIEKKLVVTAREQKGYKGEAFTKEGSFSMTIEFSPPVEMNITSAYGVSRSETGYHLGVDLYNPNGTPIMAAAEGVVTFVGYESSYGNLIVIDHGGSVQTYYAHCNTMNVEEGDPVSMGDYIGTVGNTGRTTGSHLHLEIRLNGFTLDPMDYL